mmetsp:Transcript_3854/g.6594  ORF Transcript_3854/g.6594 Transcript_3854/m.6594 type:complete len:431 (+) Transcript_3854:160-1452(+)
MACVNACSALITTKDQRRSFSQLPPVQAAHRVTHASSKRAASVVASLRPVRTVGIASRHMRTAECRTTTTPVRATPSTNNARLGRKTRSVRVTATGTAEGTIIDADALQALNEVCSRAIKVMLNEDVAGAEALDDELEEQRRLVVEYEQDYECARFLAIVQGLLNHLFLPEVANLSGPYLKAFTNIANIVDGSDWTLEVLGAPEVKDEPEFDTWEEVNQKQEKKRFNKTFNISEEEEEKPVDSGINPNDLYALLKSRKDATQKELRQNYRGLALQWHPDVSKEPNAQEVFILISRAYEILSDKDLRENYDTFGIKGLEGKYVEREKTWEEFQKFEKRTRGRQARDASAAGLNTHRAPPSVGKDEFIQVGAIVEYVLSAAVKADLQDGREKGVAILVGRNVDRGDRKTLPEGRLYLTEIEPLIQSPIGSNR